MSQSQQEAATLFVRWLSNQIAKDASGSGVDTLDVEPSGRIWMGTLAPEEAVLDLGWGDRGERLDPCAIGIVFRPVGPGPWTLTAEVRMRAWQKNGKQWSKCAPVLAAIPVQIPNIDYWSKDFGSDVLQQHLTTLLGQQGLSAEIRTHVEHDDQQDPVVTVTLVNTSPKTHSAIKDTRLYETSLASRRGIPSLSTRRSTRLLSLRPISCGIRDQLWRGDRC